MVGEDRGTWKPQVQFDLQSPNLSSFGAPLHVGKQNATSEVMNPGVNVVTRNEAVQSYAPSAVPPLQLGSANEPHGWFYCLPRFRQGFTPAPNFTSEVKPPAGHVKGSKENIVPNGELSLPKKQFLVIDQTGDQTTLIYSSRFGNSVERLASWDSKLCGPNNLNMHNEPPLRGDVNHVVGVGPALDDKVDENQGTDIESEMHEDTEEINALLYSDSDGYSSEEDEVTSTGHSPSTMTTHDNPEPLVGAEEEVASSHAEEEVAISHAREAKKRKQRDDRAAYGDDMQFMDTANSLNQNWPFDTEEDDAESRCSSDNFSRGNKKMRKDKIQDVLSVLQCIVPGGKDKDPIQLLDEAIRCLKSLKLKAKALGIGALINKSWHISAKEVYEIQLLESESVNSIHPLSPSELY